MGIFNKKPQSVPGRRQVYDDKFDKTRGTSQSVFQRNRTLTGSTSQRVNHASGQSDLKSPRAHAHHLATMRRKVGMILLIVLAAAGLMFWLLVQFTATVKVSVSDTNLSKPIDSARYEKAINDYLGFNPVSRLRFALNGKDLTEFLNNALPEVNQVVSTSLGSSIGTTDFTLSMRHPVAGWQINNHQYFVDEKGVAFEQNYYENPTVQIVDESGAALQQGATIASNRFLGFVGRVVALAGSRGYVVTNAILPSGTTRQLEIKLKDVASRIKFSIDRSAGEQVEDMARAVDYLRTHGQSPDYVDIRVSGKAFYR